ncbi:hypothetical protein LG943_02860 [Streptomonospora sp. S1-112]|uniref:Uncharacterized protein n=1 Tax=Streptomonospora mangrovi TaxID=2883123 RepID=A0A9X3NHR3_9ACTN|nr:hypothetical protein [Streptomonospora mangrovi]MDA0563275.1 hypothetical protein [Streptomonospora mangrovi]
MAAPARERAEELRARSRRLVAHDTRRGGDAVAGAALAAWRCARRPGPPAPARVERDLAAARAEAAEVAGWVLFDAGHPGARLATREAHALAAEAGDSAMAAFALTNLALQELEAGRAGAARAAAAELLERPRLPGRTALLARVRLARALARGGSTGAALAALGRAEAALEDSRTARDPAWTWWVDEGEVLGHRGLVLLALGRPGAALEALLGAAETVAAQPAGARGALFHRVSAVGAAAAARAWPECAAALAGLPEAAAGVESARNRRRLRTALLRVERAPGAPAPLVELARHTARRLPRAARPAGPAQPPQSPRPDRAAQAAQAESPRR